MSTNSAKELFLQKMSQFPADRWQQSDDVIRFMLERAQRKAVEAGQESSMAHALIASTKTNNNTGQQQNRL
jgi:hypothetical protein